MPLVARRARSATTGAGTAKAADSIASSARSHESIDATFEQLGETIEEEVGQAISLGAKALRDALKSSFSEDAWGDALFAEAEAPTGEDFVCEDNQIVVSQLRKLRLVRAEFSRNTLNAADISDFEIGNGRA